VFGEIDVDVIARQMRQHRKEGHGKKHNEDFVLIGTNPWRKKERECEAKVQSIR
jgi:hypothetical protein